MDKKHIINFWSKVDIKTPEECWEWTAGKRSEQGYGDFWDPRKKNSTLAHRFIWEYYYGPIGDSKIQVLHSCDNPPCVNMYHLHLGDHKLNMLEKKLRGRCNVIVGSANRLSKLNEEKVLEIKKLIGTITNEEIAKKFNVRSETIHHIWRRKTWKHVGKDIQLPSKLLKHVGVRGSSNTKAKLTEENVKFIREHIDEYRQIDLARMFNVNKSTIYWIKLRKNWAHI